MQMCENCKSEDLEIKEIPLWNLPSKAKKEVTFYAKCLNCNKPLMQKVTFNNIDEYIDFTERLRNI